MHIHADPWPGDGLTRIPYDVYQNADTASQEQTRIFEGATWNYLCLEAELPEPGDYVTTFLGEMPVIVTRDLDGEINAFENRCAHRGALLCLDDAGNAKRLSCVYHAWSYDLSGKLRSVAFQRGVNGKGGMSDTFSLAEHSLRKLHVARLCGLVFGSLSDQAPSIEDYLGADVLARIRRVLCKPVVVIGRVTQSLPNNWKLYVENVKDSYHASLLHLFLTTFKLNRLTMRGGLIVSPDGAHHVSYSCMEDAPKVADTEYQEEQLRTDSGYRLQDNRMLQVVDEFGDGITTQILSVFPGLVLHQVQNSIAVRQILPKGVASTHLLWTYLGFADDTPELRLLRKRQTNMVGPAGFVSMEDGAVGGFVQRGSATATGRSAVLEMGGDDAVSQDTRATEAAVRGFWKSYRRHMETA
jgi:phenylpropionate dioxygenase-like ring-hydroxylating dioxygenase large terminal subunit